MAKSRPLMQKCMAEFLGVFILCLIGNGSVAETLVKWDDSWRMHSFTGLQSFFQKSEASIYYYRWSKIERKFRN